MLKTYFLCLKKPTQEFRTNPLWNVFLLRLVLRGCNSIYFYSENHGPLSSHRVGEDHSKSQNSSWYENDRMERENYMGDVYGFKRPLISSDEES